MLIFNQSNSNIFKSASKCFGKSLSNLKALKELDLGLRYLLLLLNEKMKKYS